MKLDNTKKIVLKIEKNDIKNGVLKIPEGVEMVSHKALKNKNIAFLIHKVSFPSTFKLLDDEWMKKIKDVTIVLHPDCKLTSLHSLAMLKYLADTQPLEKEKGYVVARKIDDFYTKFNVFRDISNETIPSDEKIKLNEQNKCKEKMPWTYFKSINSALLNASRDCFSICNKHRECEKLLTGTTPFLGKNCPYKLLECEIGSDEGAITPKDDYCKTRYLTDVIKPIKEMTSEDIMQSIHNCFNSSNKY